MRSNYITDRAAQLLTHLLSGLKAYIIINTTDNSEADKVVFSRVSAALNAQ